MNIHIEKNIHHASETNMVGSHKVICGGERPVPSLIVNDLCAQMATLNRYGLPSVGAAVADGLRALVGASRTAVSSAVRCDDEA
jgi:hypothetical protein